MYLTASRDLKQVAVTFALGDQRSPLRFEKTATALPTLVQDGQPGIVSAAWLQGLTVRTGDRLLLGYVVGPADSSASWTIYGMSASALDSGRAVHVLY